jgi:hypothetical protein
MTVGHVVAIVGLGVGLVGAALLMVQLRPTKQRYRGTMDGEIEWQKLQRDQFWTALIVAVSLVMQIVAVVVS